MPATFTPPVIDPRDKLGVEGEDPVEPEDVRHEIVGEHRQLGDVFEARGARPRQVRRGDLSALEERDRPAVVSGAVGERRPPCERVDELHRRAAGAVDERGERAVEAGQQPLAEIVQRIGEQPDQLVLWVLPEDARELEATDRPEFGGGPRAAQVEPAPDAGGDRRVAAEPGQLAQRREPARAEVDRVEREPVRRADLALVGVVDERGRDRPRHRQGGGIRHDPPLLDPRLAGGCGDPGALLPDACDECDLLP